MHRTLRGSVARRLTRRNLDHVTPFLNRDAEAHGWSPGAVRSASWVHPVAGVSLPAVFAEDLASICRAASLVLPKDAVFTHVTSALLRSWRLPNIPDAPLIACSDADASHLDRRGVYVRRCGIPARHRVWLGDLRVASPAWTIVELAEHLSLIDLVVVIDGALHVGDTTIDDIRGTMMKGRRGVRVLRRALDLCDGRSESAWETILRLLHVLAGVAVDVQFVLRDTFGQCVARGDLRIHGTRRLVEYDGEYHRDRAQHERDLSREKAIVRAGHERLGYTKSEVVADALRILRDADEVMGRRHDPTRLRIWLAEVEASTLSARGWGALQRRLRRFVRSTPPRTTS